MAKALGGAWGQIIDENGYPKLLASVSEEQQESYKVCKVTFMSGETEVGAQYVNSGGTAAGPTTTPAAPDDGNDYTFGWFTEDSDTAWDFANDKVTGDITLTARWTAVYTVTIGTLENGTIKADKEKAEEGAAVTLTVTPNNGWQLKEDSLKVTYGNGETAAVTGSGNRYSFTMPAGDVTFGPDDTLSRAMLAQILYNASGGVPVNYLMQYDDVPADVWYTEAVRWATSEGVVLTQTLSQIEIQRKVKKNAQILSDLSVFVLYR